MQRWRNSAGAALAALAFVIAGHTAADSAPCDENDPAGPTRGTQITLSAADYTDEARDEMRTSFDTGGLGKVTVSIAEVKPTGIVRSFSSAPEVSRYSPLYGEQLKGIVVRVSLRRGGDRGAVVRVSLRQVCAQYFRDSFLSN